MSAINGGSSHLPDRESIAALPKAELHVHIEGTLQPHTVFALAERNGVELAYPDMASLEAAYEFVDLQSFLDVYYDCAAVLRSAEDFADMADAYLVKAAADGVTRAEIFFDPQAHTSRGVPLAEVMAGLSSALRGASERYGISAGLIACFLRDRGPDDAIRTFDELAPYRDSLIGIGLDSAEVGYPPGEFAAVFAAAEQLGLHKVAHAGEEGPPAYIWEALDVLGVERIDHGIRAVEDSALLKRLATDRIPLTVCPLSNVRLNCVPDLRAHPLPALLNAGVLVTLNSDDPAYFGGHLAENYRAVADAFGYDLDMLRALADVSLAAAFTD
ncbi:MAG: adenosine deaminase [Mycobacterium sp.]